MLLLVNGVILFLNGNICSITWYYDYLLHCDITWNYTIMIYKWYNVFVLYWYMVDWTITLFCARQTTTSTKPRCETRLNYVYIFAFFGRWRNFFCCFWWYCIFWWWCCCCYHCLFYGFWWNGHYRLPNIYFSSLVIKELFFWYHTKIFYVINFLFISISIFLVLFIFLFCFTQYSMIKFSPFVLWPHIWCFLWPQNINLYNIKVFL